MKTLLPEVKRGQMVLQTQSAARAIPPLVRRWQWTLLDVALVVVDSLLILVAFRLASYLRFDLGLDVFQLDAVERQPFYQLLYFVLFLLWLGMFAGLGLYHRHNLLGGTEEYARVFRASTYCLLIVIVAGFLAPEFVIARGWLILVGLLTFLCVSVGRFLLRRLIYALRRRGLFLSRTLIIGANREGISLAQQLLAWQTSGLQIVGFIDKKLPPGTTVWHDLSVLGNVEQLEGIVAEFQVEEIVLASSAVSVRDNLLQVFQRYGVSGGVNLRLSSGLYEIITTGLTVREFAYVPLVGVNKVRLTGVDVMLKFLLDYFIAIPGLIVISPVLLLIALAIKLDSPGPILHRRRVMGVKGSQFEALKFRTMHVNGDEILARRPDLRAELALNHKLRQDPRVTRVGRILRRTSLDELPQLFNVLRRDMSLVGPRMIAPGEMPQYDHWGINLLTVKPGITGLWQVSGRSSISYKERVQLDMYYIRNWSIWLDLQLLWQTIPAVLRGTGAY